jgi:hypothetical protein
VQIQDYLIAVVQNIELLIAHARPKPRVALALVNMKETNCAGVQNLTQLVLSALGCELYIGQAASQC